MIQEMQQANEQFAKTYSIKEVEKMTGIKAGTLRHWEKEFELNIPKWTSGPGVGNRYYTDFELSTIKKIKTMRDKNLSIDVIKEVIQRNKLDDIEDSQTPVFVPPGDFSHLSQQDAVELLKKLPEAIEETIQSSMKNALEGPLKEFINQQLNTHSSQLKIESEASKIAERERRFNEITVQKRIELKLEDEAETLWNQKPEDERFKKRFFGLKKVERMDEKNKFIRRYINQHFEDRLRIEFGIGE